MQSREYILGLPYHPISQHYKSTFGERVYKIPVSVSGTCPNREGIRGMKTCNFCDVWGSAAYPDLQKDKLVEQIASSRDRVLKRVNAAKFLVYFQAYTTTFSRVAELRGHIETAMNFEGVVGFVVGTRPDCISDALFELLNEYADKCYVAVEFGVQSFNEDTLLWMRRGHTAERSIQAIHRTKKECPKVNLGIHLIFGAPNETDEEIMASAQICNSLPIHNVKLHNLHVLKNTPLAEDFAQGQFNPLTRDDYFARVKVFLQHLSPKIAVHRLAALSTKTEELIAPDWTGNKMETYQLMLNYMKNEDAYQGQLYKTQEIINA